MQPYVLIITTALIDLILALAIWTVILEARGQYKLIGKLAHVLHY